MKTERSTEPGAPRTSAGGCNHTDPMVSVTEAWPEARSVLLSTFLVDSWCTVCGAVWLNQERASAFGFDGPVWLRPTGMVPTEGANA